MHQTSKVAYSRTFQDLRDWALKEARVSNHFGFLRLGPCYTQFWEDINRIEYTRGYDPEEYLKPNAPALCQMKLLTEEELKEWKKRFKSFHR